MTEAEWLITVELAELLLVLGRSACPRLCYLQHAASHRHTWASLPALVRRGIEVLEQVADRTALASDVTNAIDALRPYVQRASVTRSEVAALKTAAAVLSALLEPNRISYLWLTDQPERSAAIIRDIFGNPFRPVAFSPDWRTDTAVTLARQMYEARDFGAMPILADAIQDAGCDSDDILTHCRGAGPHVRGCWVVDLVLGKE